MRIGQVVKAKKLRKGDRVLILNADGEPYYNTVIAVDQQYEAGWLSVHLEGVKDIQEIEGKTRVVIWK